MTKNIAECVCQPKCHILYHKRKNKIEQIIMVITCPTNWFKISLSTVSYTIHSKNYWLSMIRAESFFFYLKNRTIALFNLFIFWIYYILKFSIWIFYNPTYNFNPIYHKRSDTVNIDNINCNIRKYANLCIMF